MIHLGRTSRKIQKLQQKLFFKLLLLPAIICKQVNIGKLNSTIKNASKSAGTGKCKSNNLQYTYRLEHLFKKRTYYYGGSVPYSTTMNFRKHKLIGALYNDWRITERII
jgi:hypothetical protein